MLSPAQAAAASDNQADQARRQLLKRTPARTDI
jgi:hypothetical protein